MGGGSSGHVPTRYEPHGARSSSLSEHPDMRGGGSQGSDPGCELVTGHRE